MLAVEKTHRINKKTAVVKVKKISKKISDKNDNEFLDVFETDAYKKTKKQMTPGDYIKIFRENLQITQQELGDELGVSNKYISDLENSRRAVSKEKAKQLSVFFKKPIDRFIF